jgi:TolB-like protein
MKIWQELRRRRVFRLTGLYVVGAWLVVQVADIVLPAWALPETAMRYLIIAATLCFPIALVFGWFFDITPNGIVRTPPSSEAKAVDVRLRRSDYVILIALLFVTGAILAHTERPPNSLAVLPFENLDPNPDTEYFSNGISEEILHKLSSVHALKVLGRTSSFAFGASDQGPKRISEILGVRYLLSGTVRREADNVRITARLLDEAGFQVWSASFDGALESIFDLQSSIASDVASQITNELVQPAGSGSKTDNMEAYRYYLVGNEYFNKRPPNWHENAEEAFRAAIAADPDYAPAYVGLANSMSVGTGPRRFLADLEEFDASLETALRLDPGNAGAYATRGMSRIDSPVADLDAAVKDLERSVQLDPNNPMSLSWLATAYIAAGRFDEGMANQDRGLDLDPFNVPLVLNTSERFLLAGDIDGAIEHVGRLLLMPEPPGPTYVVLSGYHELKRDFPGAIKWIKESIRKSGPADPYGTGQLSFLYDLLGMRDEANYWFERYEEAQTNPLVLLFHQVERYVELGEKDKAAGYLQRFEHRQGFNLAEYPPHYETIFAVRWLTVMSRWGCTNVQPQPVRGGIRSPNASAKMNNSMMTKMLCMRVHMCKEYTATAPRVPLYWTPPSMPASVATPGSLPICCGAKHSAHLNLPDLCRGWRRSSRNNSSLSKPRMQVRTSVPSSSACLTRLRSRHQSVRAPGCLTLWKN